MFPTKTAAEKRDKELKCKGSFAMGSMWMRCANERALHDALQKAQSCNTLNVSMVFIA
jgi:hypothetical protein